MIFLINEEITTLYNLRYDLADNLSACGNKYYQGEKGLNYLINEVYENTQGLLLWKNITGITWESFEGVHTAIDPSYIYIPYEHEGWQAFSADTILLRFNSSSGGLMMIIDFDTPATYEITTNVMQARVVVESSDGTGIFLSHISAKTLEETPPAVEYTSMFRMFDNPLNNSIEVNVNN